MLSLNKIGTITGLIILILSATILVAHTANAEINENPFPHYFTVNAGISKLTNRCEDLAAGFTCKDSAFAYSFEEGYQINKFFGVELALAIYGSPKTSGTVLTSTLEVAEEVNGFRFSGTATLPLTESFALTGRLGYAQTNIGVVTIVSPGPSFPHYSVTNETLVYGAGIKYNINKHFAVHLKYDYLGEIGDDMTGKHKLSLISTGLSYYFDIAKPRNQAPQTVAPPMNPQDTPDSSGATQSTLRVIVHLKNPADGNKAELQNAIATACQCQPIFVRLQNHQEIIYQINLATGQSFSAFKATLLNGEAALGIQDIQQEQSPDGNRTLTH
jgi:opacity protein-like surface antigen